MTLAFSCEVVHEKLWKSVNIFKSYSKKINGTFFLDTVYCCIMQISRFSCWGILFSIPLYLPAMGNLKSIHPSMHPCIYYQKVNIMQTAIQLTMLNGAPNRRGSCLLKLRCSIVTPEHRLRGLLKQWSRHTLYRQNASITKHNESIEYLHLNKRLEYNFKLVRLLHKLLWSDCAT